MQGIEALTARIRFELPSLSNEDAAELARVVHRLVDALAPERIYVFGSRARGEATSDSDVDLLVIDELGYTAMDAHRANLLFQLISDLYTPASVIVTTNLAFDHWGSIFGGDEVIASAILDRPSTLLVYLSLERITKGWLKMRELEGLRRRDSGRTAPNHRRQVLRNRLA